MAIFRRFFEDVFPMVPTLLRRTASNLINVTYETMFKGMDAVAQALEEYVDAWPIDTAPGWVLDTHWGPYHNLQRNGMTDADYRLYIHAKRMLNKSWGAGPQALGIFALLLPAAGLTFSYFAPKSWVVNITGVDMATAAPAILFSLVQCMISGPTTRPASSTCMFMASATRFDHAWSGLLSARSSLSFDAAVSMLPA